MADSTYYDLGSYTRSITTTSKEAQVWFDRGLIWSYAFNHEEAAKCFENAISSDSECAMAWWGLAYCSGPNYNKPWEAFDEREKAASVARTHSAVTTAARHSVNATLVEKALIRALELRYPEEEPSADSTLPSSQILYANAMETVYNNFPNDLDVAALYADALMNLRPWQLWDLKTGEPAEGAPTLKVKNVLDKALATPAGLQHPGLLHLYIHLMEMSKTPETALPISDRLRGLVPDSGHLNHMPTHLDILCGDYGRAITSNSDAIRADQKFLAQAGPLNFYTLYRCHNYHFKIYAAMFSGQSKIALQTATELQASITEDLLRVTTPPMADWLEGFVSIIVHVLVRFGRWADLIALPFPSDPKLYSVTTAMLHYGKGIAYASTNLPSQAEEQSVLLSHAMEQVPESRTLFNNKCADILTIASAMLSGEIAYRQGKHDLAFTSLRHAIHIDDNLPYDEPWGWMQPTRHAYGALLLEQGHVESALAVYVADLGIDGTLPRALQHPGNVWALAGYHECLVRLGREEEAVGVEARLREARESADVEVRASCFCRLGREE